ncbi:hypothetical protein HMI54_007802 [Coelomomyces lativittatus]|nr:hypothetical protein HMI54_007802 [Coelomomyces lativittatus]KAJ1508675.1 hypothetical protein HMI56_007171 [Coelomomyces lativittatus]KAJ1517982.1 hypothetical protein HMI55_004258 [Coelomomyces lativittatus]
MISSNDTTPASFLDTTPTTYSNAIPLTSLQELLVSSTSFLSRSLPSSSSFYCILLFLWFFSIPGTLLRMGLSSLPLTNPSVPVPTLKMFIPWSTFSSLTLPQGMGCFFMGMLMGVFPFTKRQSPKYIGLTTGFCGALTTFSGALVISMMEGSGLLHGLPMMWWSFWFLSALTWTMVMSISVCAYHLGHHVALTWAGKDWTPPLWCQTLVRRSCSWGHCSWNKSIYGMVIFIFFYVGIVFVFFYTLWIKAPSSWLLAILLSPIGTTLRFILTCRWGSKNGIMYANTLAVVLTCVLGVLNLYVPEIQWLTFGTRSGFCGTLSSMSSWIAVLVELSFLQGIKYFTKSVAPCVFLIFIILGIPTFLHRS